VTAPPPAPSRARARIFLAGKVVLAALLITFLLRSGSLDFNQLKVFGRRPLLMLANVGLSALGILVGALRWSLLLRLANVRIPLRRAIQLQMTALFFNTAIPGGVGGDLVKSGYAAREAEPGKRAIVFLVVLVERMLGLAGLVIVAGIVILLRGPVLWNDPQLRPVALTVAALAGLTVAGPLAFVVVLHTSGARLERWTSGPSRIAKLASRLVAAARLVSSRPKYLATALGLSMVLHAVSMGFFTALASAITAQDVPYSAIASVFPIGILTVLVPISPGGIGVGHVAFDKLFAIIGLSGGANVFNCYIVGQMSLGLLGVFPYLALKRSHALPSQNE
jgi:glycosyltransferase 2 family protein